MYAPVWRQVTGGGHRAVEGTLRGFERRRIRGAPYPALVRAQPESAVRGVVRLDVSARDLRALDRFEGEGQLYARIRVPVELGTGAATRAWTYLYLLAERVEADRWDPARFEREDLGRFLSA